MTDIFNNLSCTQTIVKSAEAYTLLTWAVSQCIINKNDHAKLYIKSFAEEINKSSQTVFLWKKRLSKEGFIKCKRFNKYIKITPENFINPHKLENFIKIENLNIRLQRLEELVS